MGNEYADDLGAGGASGNSMQTSTQPAAPAAQSSAPPGARPRPYVAPAIIFRTALEAVAANCYDAPGKAELTDCIVGNS